MAAEIKTEYPDKEVGTSSSQLTSSWFCYCSMVLLLEAPEMTAHLAAEPVASHQQGLWHWVPLPGLFLQESIRVEGGQL